MNGRLVLVGNPEENHIGAHLFNAAEGLGLQVRLCDIREAFGGSELLSKINWHFRGHRPHYLRKFSKEAVHICREFQPKWMLATGLAPIDSKALIEIGKMGIKRLNYLTDDPWNPAHRARWFTKALPGYDSIFSPRRANIGDLKKLGCRSVSYLPFAYAPEMHFPQHASDSMERSKFSHDVMFAGCADRERVGWLQRLIKEGFNVGLYGRYWERYKETKRYTRGQADPQTLRKATSDSKLALCLVRWANRDGNSMRTFEIPAMGTCMLTEDTEEHREILGEEGKNVFYFKNANEMLSRLRFLLDNEAERKRLASSSYTLIVKGNNTYRDRLNAMLAPLDTVAGLKRV